MKWKRLIISAAAAAALISAPAAAADDADSLRIARYEQRLEQRLNNWKRLIPNLMSLQYAGGIGTVSAGVGWDYGPSDNWETHVLVGYLPRKYHHDEYWTFTVRENYLPWRLGFLGEKYRIAPLCVSLSVNSILHSDFWTSEPDRYPSGYYGFSSRIRFHLGIGQRFTYNIPLERRYLGRQISVYYEISTCDLYVRQKMLNGSIPLRDIIILGAGIIYTI